MKEILNDEVSLKIISERFSDARKLIEEGKFPSVDKLLNRQHTLLKESKREIAATADQRSVSENIIILEELNTFIKQLEIMSSLIRRGHWHDCRRLLGQASAFIEKRIEDVRK